MLKRRVILGLTLNDGVLFRTKNFVPDYRYTLSYVDYRLADELIILDVTRPGGDRTNFERVIKEIADQLALPIAIGGWIRNIVQVQRLFRQLGADKVVINTEAVNRPSFISELAKTYGSQAVVVSIDARDGGLLIEQGRKLLRHDPVEWARQAAGLGAGEIVVLDANRDGALEGYNLELLHRIVDAVKIPVVIRGGCGNWAHMKAAFDAGADGAVTQNIFHFTNPSLAAAKKYLHDCGIPVRMT
jgi:cyclase